jgi:hypothetical protein
MYFCIFCYELYNLKWWRFTLQNIKNSMFIKNLVMVPFHPFLKLWLCLNNYCVHSINLTSVYFDWSKYIYAFLVLLFVAYRECMRHNYYSILVFSLDLTPQPLVPRHRSVTCKTTLWVWKGYFIGKIQQPFLFHVSLALLLYDCWWELLESSGRRLRNV